MSEVEVVAVTSIIQEIISVGETLRAAYQRWRALAVAVGVSDAEMQAADARFAYRASDPFAGQTHTITPITTPPSLPPTSDPTSIEYDTLDEAKAHVTDQYPFVIQRWNGKFSVYSVVSPFPGTKVYPQP